MSANGGTRLLTLADVHRVADHTAAKLAIVATARGVHDPRAAVGIGHDVVLAWIADDTVVSFGELAARAEARADLWCSLKASIR